MWTVFPLETALRGAALTALTLLGGIIVGVVLGLLTFEALPGHTSDGPSALRIALSAVPALAGFLLGGASWGVLIGRLGRASDWRRMALAGMLGFAPITIALAIALSAIEPVVVGLVGGRVPIHRLFTLLFVPAAFVIGGVSAWAIGRGMGNRSLAWRLSWRVGVAAALAFLAANLVMEALGWVVGAPGAADRLTMLTVTLAGNAGAALAGGAVLGRALESAVAKPAQPSTGAIP